jgi:hypothetical protein
LLLTIARSLFTIDYYTLKKEIENNKKKKYMLEQHFRNRYAIDAQEGHVGLLVVAQVNILRFYPGSYRY